VLPDRDRQTSAGRRRSRRAHAGPTRSATIFGSFRRAQREPTSEPTASGVEPARSQEIVPSPHALARGRTAHERATIAAAATASPFPASCARRMSARQVELLFDRERPEVIGVVEVRAVEPMASYWCSQYHHWSRAIWL